MPYTTKIYTTPELKQPAFLALNRNGMAPVIEDPNKGIRLAEVSVERPRQYPSEQLLNITVWRDYGLHP